MISMPPVELNCSSTGATACTYLISLSRSPMRMGMGAPLNARKTEAEGGCSMMSAPTPSMRLAVSCSMPLVSPTIMITSVTSTATASTLTSVRTGRCRTFLKTSLADHGWASCPSVRPRAPVGAGRLREHEAVAPAFGVKRQLGDVMASW